MKKVLLVIILLVIIIATTAAYYFIAHFGNVYMAKTNSQTTNNPSSLCQNNQLATSLSAQGAAGNIYDTLVLTNKGKTACTVVLGNTITAQFSANNMTVHYVENVSSQNFVLAPATTAYSQIHYPNGPQCQSGIKPQPISFLYKTDQTSVVFASDAQTGKMVVQACVSPTEKTTIDIWPLSKQPITP
jgi:hypothetical protein